MRNIWLANFQTSRHVCMHGVMFSISNTLMKLTIWASVAYAENFHGGVLVQGHMVVNCFWCALFLTSQFDVTSMFPNQRFGEVFWHSMHIFQHPLSLLYMSLHWIWTISAPSYATGEKQTQRYDTAVHNCKNNRLRVKTGEWNTLIATSEQFTTT